MAKPETPLDFSASMQPNSSTIIHRLRDRRSSPIWKLTKRLLLDTFDPTLYRHEEEPLKVWNTVAKAYELQRICRLQTRELMSWQLKYNADIPQELRSKAALRFTYEVNCRPSGFFATPKTLVCRSATCPWCYVRKVYRYVFMPLSAKLRKIRNLDGLPVKLAYWRRSVPFADAANNLPFFRANYGPHQWLQAYMSLQYVVPVLVDNQLTLRHVVFQLIPPDVDGKPLLQRRSLIKQSQKFEYAEARKLGDTNKATDSVLISAIGYGIGFPFYELFLPDNFWHFEAAHKGFKHKRLVRISPINKKGGEDASG